MRRIVTICPRTGAHVLTNVPEDDFDRELLADRAKERERREFEKWRALRDNRWIY